MKIKKSLIIFIVILFILNTIMPLLIFAEGSEDETTSVVLDQIEYKILDKEAKTAMVNYAYSKSSLVNINIKEKVNINGEEYVVTKISGLAFCDNLESVTIPDTVTVIDHSTFAMCPNLKEVNLPNNLKEMGRNVFSFCTSLKSIKIPGTLRSLMEGTFTGCSSLENITLENGLEYIEGYVFSDCNKLKELNLPKTVRGITKTAFIGAPTDLLVRVREDDLYIVNSIRDMEIGNGEEDGMQPLNVEIIRIPIERIEVEPNDITMGVGNNFDIKINFYPEDNTTINKKIDIESEDSSVAIGRYNSGESYIYGAGLGETVLTVKCNDTYTANINVKVIGSQITFPNREESIEPGDSIDLKYTVTDVDGNVSDVKPEEMQWEVRDPDIISVDNGRVTALKKGNSVVYAHYNHGRGRCIIYVRKELKGISLSENLITGKVGDEQRLYANYVPEDADYKGSIKWNSSNTSVASIDYMGYVNMLSPGTAVITATTNGFEAQCTVIVREQEILVEEIKLNRESLQLENGESFQLTAELFPEDATNKEIIWSSSDDSIVSVSEEGLVKALKCGDNITITAMSSSDNTKQAIVNVSVAHEWGDWKITKEASWQEDGEKTRICNNNVNHVEKEPYIEEIPFKDIDRNDWYVPFIEYCYKNNLITGYKDNEHIGMFGPQDLITRGQIVTILYRREGQPTISGKLNFIDKNDSTLWSANYYNDAILWASQNGIVTGYKDGDDSGKFLPDKPITREELAIILQRYAKLKGISETDLSTLTSFYDYELVSPWAKEGLEWTVAKGIISGDEITTPPSLKPQENATRAEATTMIMRFCNI